MKNFTKSKGTLTNNIYKSIDSSVLTGAIALLFNVISQVSILPKISINLKIKHMDRFKHILMRKGFSRVSMPKTIIILLAALLSFSQLRANTYTVTNANSSGSGSLSQAISDANGHAGAD